MRKLTKDERQASDKRKKERENLRRRLLRKNNPELVLARERKYWGSPRGKEVLKAWAKTPKGHTHYRKNTLKRYGLTVDQYNSLLLKQNGVCAVCFRPETIESKNGATCLTVDHCHETGKVRGLLCRKCNMAIGLLGDNCEVLKKAIDYLIFSKKT